MSALTVRLPNSVHQTIKELAARDEISVNQFMASAAAEKMAAVLTLDDLRVEAAKGRRPKVRRLKTGAQSRNGRNNNQFSGMLSVGEADQR